jgi:hypothetical protein
MGATTVRMQSIRTIPKPGEAAKGSRRTRLRIGAVLVAVLNGAVVVGIGPASSDATVGTVGRARRPTRAPEAPESIPRPVVLLYGDSLAWEAREHFVAAFAERPDVEVITKTFGGTAICDWLAAMRTDATAIAPGAVVVEFSGNALTACMQDLSGRPLTGDAYLKRYRSDAEAVVGIFRPIGAHLYFVGAPSPRPSAARSDFSGGRLNAIYEQIASSRSNAVEFVDAGAAVLDDGLWTATLLCLRGEPCEGGTDGLGRGVNLVRAPDGNHFCPAGEQARAGVTGPCSVWSSGAFRFGGAMARPVVAALGVPH